MKQITKRNMQTKGLFLLAVIVVLSLSARRDKYKMTVYDMHYIEENLCYIPTGSFNLGFSDEDVPYPTTRSRTVNVDSFYMSRYELTNGMYCYYLYQLQLAKVDTAQYNKALPDTLVWREKLAYNEPYVDYYLRHPAYADYPLVGVTYEQAITFCKWLTTTYNQWPQRKYKQMNFDLPSKDQWMAAAHGGLALSPFPWGGPYMQNSKGQWLANFRIVDQGSVYRKPVPEPNVFGKIDTNIYMVAAGTTYFLSADVSGMQDAADVTAPVNSYFPNDYGLHNLSGNVEEMIKEKGITKGGSWRDTGYYLKIESEENYTDSTAASSERGFRIMMTINN